MPPEPHAEETVAVVTGVASDSVFHEVEDGEPACGPSIRSNNFRLTERDALGSHYRRCRTCFGERESGGGAPIRADCPFCGEAAVVLHSHLPECDGADAYFEKGVAR